MPVLRKAGAIVTDEGGITSHAAIIARELKIPCIIGTKIATKVLEDGDLVEVDADNGTVRILTKQKDVWIKNVTREVTIFPAAAVTKSFGQIGDAFDIPFDY
jgi:phosphoenolpyruvate synthase/pyruvate phosphate dikinase